MGTSHERKASPGFTDYIRFQHVRSTPVLRLIQQKLLINNSIKMRYSFALLAGVAAASYIPEAPSSSSVAPSSSAKGNGYGGDYWPKSSSSSSVKAPYVPKSSSAPYKPTYTPKPVYPSYTPTKPAYTPSASVTKTGPLQVTANAAVNNVAGAGAALAGVFGAVAYLL